MQAKDVRPNDSKIGYSSNYLARDFRQLGNYKRLSYRAPDEIGTSDRLLEEWQPNTVSEDPLAIPDAGQSNGVASRVRAELFRRL
jgi:hypothetical protein